MQAELQLPTGETPQSYYTGMRLTFEARERWYVRLWRWVTRYKAPVMFVTEVDHDTSSITISTEPPRAS